MVYCSYCGKKIIEEPEDKLDKVIRLLDEIKEILEK